MPELWATPPRVGLLEKWVVSRAICRRISIGHQHQVTHSCRRISLSVCPVLPLITLDTWTCQRSFKNVISNQDKFKCKFTSARSITGLRPSPTRTALNCFQGAVGGRPYYTFMALEVSQAYGILHLTQKVQCLASLASDWVSLLAYYIFNCFTILA